MLKTKISILGAFAASVMMASSVAQAGSHSVPKLPCDTAQLIVPWKPGGGTQVLYALVEKTISEMDTPYNLKVVTVPVKVAIKVPSKQPRPSQTVALYLQFTSRPSLVF